MKYNSAYLRLIFINLICKLLNKTQSRLCQNFETFMIVFKLIYTRAITSNFTKIVPWSEILNLCPDTCTGGSKRKLAVMTSLIYWSKILGSQKESLKSYFAIAVVIDQIRRFRLISNSKRPIDYKNVLHIRTK